MPDDVAVRLPPLAGRQQESWRAFIELTPRLGDHCLLVGGQMVFLLEVLRLVAEGLTTSRIAEQLFISPKTADRHIQNICTKIGTSTRATATRWAQENGLLATSASGITGTGAL
jgi:DNA-binding CsgD family transcriptional regulator